MRISFDIAGAGDASTIAALRNAVSLHLTSRYGKGSWTRCVSERAVVFDMKTGTVWVARQRNKVIATFRLSTRKPWAIDTKYFSASEKPLYLTTMAVHPEWQRKGIGRRCLEKARSIAASQSREVIRLDAHDAEAGAGEFYRKCGFQEVGRTKYRNTPLIYFELRP